MTFESFSLTACPATVPLTPLYALTHAGGFIITKSVPSGRCGREGNPISGGDPVIKIKSRHGKAQLTVPIQSLTVQGGRARGKGFMSQGGGIDIEPAAGKLHSQLLGAR